MSIIIKGLDLPPVSDTNGFINLSIDCYGQVVVHNTYPTKILKAEQIPKHGRLIDADSMEKEMCGGCVHSEHKYANCIDCALANAHTIIEAEGKT